MEVFLEHLLVMIYYFDGGFVEACHLFTQRLGVLMYYIREAYGGNLAMFISLELVN